MAVTKIKPIKGTLNKALDYIQNPAKTDEKMLVSSFGCSYETADIEFGFTLSQALDKGSNLSNPGSSIKLFTLSNATLPEGYTLGNVRVELSTEKGKEIGRASCRERV